MHGRIKVRTSEDQKIQKREEQKQKLAAYRGGMKKILSTRYMYDCDQNSLILSGQLLSLNPDIYTLWNYRKEVILHKITSRTEDTHDEEKFANFCEAELRLTEQCLVSNPKSYGSWHHRYWILNHHPKPKWQREFDLCNKYFSMDDRNFHCWDFRRLLMNKVGLTLTNEIAFSTERININFSNYSSWHYRSTLLKKSMQPDVVHELTLIQNAVFTDPIDTSAWFYLRWVLYHLIVEKIHKDALLNALRQLEELEPDCKWIIMAKTWLFSKESLQEKDCVDKLHHYYLNLIELDPLRKGHYMDYLKVVQQG